VQDPPVELLHATKSKRFLISALDDTPPEAMLAAPTAARLGAGAQEDKVNALVADCRALNTFGLTKDIHMKVWMSSHGETIRRPRLAEGQVGFMILRSLYYT
jgi:hypothetical protein